LRGKIEPIWDREFPGYLGRNVTKHLRKMVGMKFGNQVTIIITSCKAWASHYS
jgi:hypothetical protein